MRARRRFGVTVLGLAALALMLGEAGGAAAGPMGLVVTAATPVTVTDTVANALPPNGSALADASAFSQLLPPTAPPFPLAVGQGFNLDTAVNGNAMNNSASSEADATAAGTLTIQNAGATGLLVTFDVPLSYSLSSSVTAPASASAGVSLVVTDSVAGTEVTFTDLVSGTASASGVLDFPFTILVAAGSEDTLTFTLSLPPGEGTASSSGSGEGTYNATATSDVQVTAITPVPEPSSLALLALGGIALAGWRRWKGGRTQATT